MTIIRKVLVGIGGGLMILIGAILIPTPAPEGWLIVFAGITLLSTEFTFAKRLLKKADRLRLRLNRWVKSLPQWLQTSVSILTVIVLVGIIVLGVWFALTIFW